MERNQWLLIIGIVVAVCVIGAACVALFAAGSFLGERGIIGGEGESVEQREIIEPIPTEGPAEEESAPTPTEAPTRPPSGEQILDLPGGEPPTLDPALTQDATSAGYIVELYSGLVTLNPDLQVVPDLARDWDVSDDGTVYTFHLREGATFHDGKPVTAGDFKFSIERASDPATASVVADTYLGDIVGARAKLRGEADEVKGVRVVDEHTLEITIDAPKAYFLSKLTYPTAFVVDQDSVEAGGRTWASNPDTANGTGPFKLAEYEIGQRIVLEPNENYYGEIKPKLEQVVYHLSGGSAMTMYETGELDATAVGLADIERVTDPSNPLNDELSVIAPTLSTFYIAFNVNKPPFDDVKVRQAFNYAIDKQKLIDVVMQGTQIKAEGILPPAMPGYNEDLNVYDFDPEKAKELLAESKYGSASELPDITLNVTGGGGATARSVTAIVEMYRENLGLEDITIEQTEWATYLQDINAHRYQMWGITSGWIADYPDPQDFLDILFHGESKDNRMGYSNPEVNELLEEARVEQDRETRFEIYQQVEKMILEDAPWVPLFHDAEYWLTKPYVEGMIYPPMIIPKLKYVSISR